MTSPQSPVPLVHLDEPAGAIVTSAATHLRGWLAVPQTENFEAVSLVNDRGGVIPLTLIERPDVRAVTPGLASTGFAGWIDIRAAGDGPWRVSYNHRESAPELWLPLAANQDDAQSFADAKARKLARIRPLLRCPKCGRQLVGDAPTLRCENDHTFGATGTAYDFLDADVRRTVGAVSTDNVSGHGYDEVLRDLIANTSGEIIDVGAGMRPEYREDVVNVEIVPYATTDVIAASEYLPFADASFDLVISVAVLEHVRDPFAAARELERIMRPGGRIFAAVPFLQPYHGYPNHYYNMTSAGLRNLFKDSDVERLFVPASGGPAFALTWILRWWRDALPPETAAAFAALTVSDLTVEPESLLNEPFVRELPESVNDKLAALNVLIARKRGASS